jgi:hypothetical protein
MEGFAVETGSKARKGILCKKVPDKVQGRYLPGLYSSQP